MTTPSRLLPALLLAAGLGCLRSSPPVVFHTLEPIPAARADPAGSAPAGSALAGSALAGSALAVEVLPVRLPEVLRRPQLLEALGPGRLGLLESHRWGNPLDQDMQRVLVADLALLLGSDAVVPSPMGGRVAAAYRVEVEVQSCQARPGEGLVLRASWMLTRPGSERAVRVRRSVFREPLDPGPDALAAAHSAVLAALARELAAELLRRP